MNFVPYTEEWWSLVSIHEAAHGIVGIALQCFPLELKLFRRHGKNENSGHCVCHYERSIFGKVARILTKNAPFVASQYDVLPAATKDVTHERQDAYQLFVNLTGVSDEELFRTTIDDSLMGFFGSKDVQGATLFLAARLYEQTTVTIKQINYWKKMLDVPEVMFEALQNHCLNVAKAIGGVS